MKFNKTMLLLTILMTGAMFMTPTAISAVGDLSPEVEAGDTYWYTVTDFPSLAEIQTFLYDMEGGAPENVTIDVTGGLENSRLYAKVLSTQDESMSYWDGSNLVTSSSVPTVDLAVGMITGQEMTITADIEGVASSLAVPAGIGIPMPFIFGTTTYFNVSNLEGAILPIPLFLNDDYTVHSTVFNTINTQLGSNGTIDVTNDADQFRVDVDIEIDDGQVGFDGFISWRKLDGAAQTVNLRIFNTTTTNDIFNFDISLDAGDIENTMPIVEVGDEFSLTFSEFGFDYTSSGIPVEVLDFVDELKANITAEVGTTLVNIEVLETHGMYYRIGVEVYNFTDGTYFDPVETEAWMVGFGRAGPGMPLPLFGDSGDSYYYDLGLNIASHDEIRRYAVPGVVVSKDYEIYAAWDKTISFLTSTGMTAFLAALEEMDAMEPDVDIDNSLGTGSPLMALVYDYGETSDGGYENTMTGTMDVDFWMYDDQVWYDSVWNESLGAWEQYYEESYGGYERYWDGDDYYYEWNPYLWGWKWQYNETAGNWQDLYTWEERTVTVDGGMAMSSLYDNSGAFDEFSVTMDMDMTVDVIGENGTIVDASLSISNFIFTLDGSIDRVNPYVPPEDTDTNGTDTDANNTDGNNTGTEDGPALDLPGFEFVSVLSMAFIAVYARRIKK